MSRFYHNMTAHYNVYFNGDESLKEGVAKIDNAIEDDYTRLLPVYKSDDESAATVATAEMEYAVIKASKLIKLHSITKKPKRQNSWKLEQYKKSRIDFRSKQEYNNWVDDAYILMGKSYYYMHNFNSAIEKFSYVTRKFSEEETTYDALVWIIRCYIQLERYVEANNEIKALNTDRGFPPRLEGDLALATADYHIHQLEYKKAIPFLLTAIDEINVRRDKFRYKYILAQLYEETGDMTLAAQTYRELARMHPPYKMEFNARIKAAEIYNGEGNSEEYKKELQRLLRSKKNVEFHDQIYFAMANIAKKKGNMALAKDLYAKSAAASKKNMYQRALSCLTLANLFFEEPDYINSKNYYDSTMVVINESYPGYDDISERHSNLRLLVKNIQIVEREDSLQRIAQLSEAERNAMVGKWIEDAKESEKKQKEALKALENKMRGNSQSGQSRSSGWYFYAPTTVAYGVTNFQQKWGKRTLEDNWRRSNKLTRTEIEEEELAATQADSVNGGTRIVDPKNRDYYLQNLPISDSLLAISNARIQGALFSIGRIFKTVYKNYPRAIEAFIELNKRFPGSAYELSCYFELWDLYAKTGELANVEMYKTKIISEYPRSKYARYLINPNYFIELEARNDSINSIYRKAFALYRQGKYDEAGKLSDQIIQMKPEPEIIPKTEFIRTIAYGLNTSWRNFEGLLNTYIKKYPKKEITPLAERILTLIQDSTLADYQKLVEIGYLNDQIQNEELKGENMSGDDEFGGKFSYDEDLLHYFIIAYPVDSKVDVNRLKFDIANYNIDHYPKIDFDIETTLLGDKTRLVIVRVLENKEISLIYFRSIIRQREVFKTLSNTKYVNFVASSTNYREILAEQKYKEYLKFFVKNYSRFISGDFTKEVFPSPEELMAKAKAREEEKLEEKGTYVVVKKRARSRIYQVENNAPQNFVIAINDPSFSTEKLMSDLAAFNRKNFKGKGLEISQKQITGYRMIIIKSFDGKSKALQYFTRVVITRDLFKSLGAMSYRSFLISDGNLEKLLAIGNLDNYMNFFSDVYLKASSSEDSETAERTKEKTKEYDGSFNSNLSGEHAFMLIIQDTGIDKKAVVDAVKNFNKNNYPEQNYKLVDAKFGSDQLMIKTEGLKDKKEAMEYLKSIVEYKSIYKLLQNTDYRNFIISVENLKILNKNKDVSSYMTFYKRFYLNQ